MRKLTKAVIAVASAGLLAGVALAAPAKESGSGGPIYKQKKNIVSGRIRSVGKEGETITVGRVVLKIDSATQVFKVQTIPGKELKKEDTLLVYGRPGKTMVSGKGTIGRMQARFILAASAQDFIDPEPTREAIQEELKDARRRGADADPIEGWYRAPIDSLDPFGVKIGTAVQQITYSGDILGVVEGKPDDIDKRLYVIVTAQKAGAEEEEATDEDGKSEKSSRKRKSRRRKNEPEGVATAIYLCESSAPLEFLLNPPQPRVAKTRTTNSSEPAEENDTRNRSEAARRRR